MSRESRESRGSRESREYTHRHVALFTVEHCCFFLSPFCYCTQHSTAESIGHCLTCHTALECDVPGDEQVVVGVGDENHGTRKS